MLMCGSFIRKQYIINAIPLRKGSRNVYNDIEAMKRRAVIVYGYESSNKKSGDWWVGWLVDMPGVNAQEKTRDELIESLKICARDMMDIPFQPGQEEELFSISF